MNSNYIIFEGKQDEAFFKALIAKMNTNNLAVINIPEQNYFCVYGLDEKNIKLKNKIREVIEMTKKAGDTKLGIVIDMDTYTQEERLDFLKKHINETLIEQKLPIIPKLECRTPIDINVEGSILHLFVDITKGVNGKGQLDDLLWEIRLKERACCANALTKWRDELQTNCPDKCPNPKEFTELQLHYYLRWDHTDFEQRKEGGKHSKTEWVLQHKPDIFDWESNHLKGIKAFLNLFI